MYLGKRGYNYECLWWRVEKNTPIQNLIRSGLPNGRFFCKVVGLTYESQSEIGGVAITASNGLTIKTLEQVEIHKDDVVKFMGLYYTVDSVQMNFRKNEYLKSYDEQQKITLINLKGGYELK